MKDSQGCRKMPRRSRARRLITTTRSPSGRTQSVRLAPAGDRFWAKSASAHRSRSGARCHSIRAVRLRGSTERPRRRSSHTGPTSRTKTAYNYRKSTAQNEKIDAPVVLPDNGDSQRFTDFSGSWSKCLKHDALGIVNRASWLSLQYATADGPFLRLRKHPGRQSGWSRFHRNPEWSDGRLGLRLGGLGCFRDRDPARTVRGQCADRG